MRSAWRNFVHSGSSVKGLGSFHFATTSIVFTRGERHKEISCEYYDYHQQIAAERTYEPANEKSYQER